MTEKGQTANTIGNCQTVFCQDPLLKGAICLNLLTDRVDICLLYTSLRKDRTTQPPRYIVICKSKQADNLEQAFKEFTAKKLKQQERPSIRKTLAVLKEKACLLYTSSHHSFRLLLRSSCEVGNYLQASFPFSFLFHISRQYFKIGRAHV